ncbi:MAG: DUF3368 domain-containing protein [Ignavibacteria bacterium]|jgi:predicted nucleic acid-binding protein|nr:DUF3368 domain-containing protein [Ignavibacteria bacterium]
MRRTIISDASCFIVLSKIDSIELLHSVYGTIITTPEIAAEFGEPLPNWVTIENVKNIHKQQLLELNVDKGEASAIALALDTPNSTIILDDYKARKVAQTLGLKITGTIGVIVKAKLDGIIPSIKPLINSIKRTNFRITPELELQSLIAAKE